MIAGVKKNFSQIPYARVALATFDAWSVDRGDVLRCLLRRDLGLKEILKCGYRGLFFVSAPGGGRPIALSW